MTLPSTLMGATGESVDEVFRLRKLGVSRIGSCYSIFIITSSFVITHNPHAYFQIVIFLFHPIHQIHFRLLHQANS